MTAHAHNPRTLEGGEGGWEFKVNLRYCCITFSEKKLANISLSHPIK